MCCTHSGLPQTPVPTEGLKQVTRIAVARMSEAISGAEPVLKPELVLKPTRISLRSCGLRSLARSP